MHVVVATADGKVRERFHRPARVGLKRDQQLGAASFSIGGQWQTRRLVKELPQFLNLPHDSKGSLDGGGHDRWTETSHVGK